VFCDDKRANRDRSWVQKIGGSSSDVEGVSGMPSRCEHGLEDKEEVERVGDETCPESGMGGCGNLNDASVARGWRRSWCRTRRE